MANEIKCGDCAQYYAIQKPKPKGGFRTLNYGHCLARTVYAKGKPGKPVYPPGAKVADLPHNQHQVHVVRKGTVKPTCTTVQPKSRR